MTMSRKYRSLQINEIILVLYVCKVLSGPNFIHSAMATVVLTEICIYISLVRTVALKPNQLTKGKSIV